MTAPQNRPRRPTSLTVREMRAGIVLQQILWHPELVETIEDVTSLPRLRHWPLQVVTQATDDLIEAGSLTEAADGRLCARPLPHA